jgi:ATP-dependent RNA helicase RhlE
MSFSELQLSDPIRRAVEAAGYEIATPIQLEAIPPLLAGRDLVGCAQTGTGKTAAFALPTLQHLHGKMFHQPGQARTRHIRTLVLAPTRELATQIGDSFRTYGRFTGLRHTVIFGGVGQNPQVKALRNGVEIVVATPGRLLDLMNQGFVDLSHVEILILDEADQMFDMGFIRDLRRIVSRVPRQRQTLLFSATMPPEIRQLADELLHDPVSISVVPHSTPAERIDQSVYHVEKKAKPQLLVTYLKEQAAKRTLVFMRTKHGADKLVKSLMQAGIRAEAIHGNKSQNARQRALMMFKSQHPPVLVATDIAARGLDIDDVTHIVNFDLPNSPETYVHRIGRTARAGATGIAVTFCDREERSQLRDIERLTRQRLTVVGGHAPPPDLDVAPAGGGSNQPRRFQHSGGQNRGGNRPAAAGSGGGRPGNWRRFGGGKPKSRRFSRA